MVRKIPVFVFIKNEDFLAVIKRKCKIYFVLDLEAHRRAFSLPHILVARRMTRKTRSLSIE